MLHTIHVHKQRHVDDDVAAADEGAAGYRQATIYLFFFLTENGKLKLN